MYRSQLKREKGKYYFFHTGIGFGHFPPCHSCANKNKRFEVAKCDIS